MICAGLMSVVIFMYLFTSDILPHCLLLSLVFFLLFYVVFVIVVAAVLILLFLFYSDIARHFMTGVNACVRLLSLTLGKKGVLYGHIVRIT